MTSAGGGSGSGAAGTGLPVEWTPADHALYDALVKLRWSVSQDKKVPAYVVFNNKQLQELVRKKPTTERSFQQCEGVGAAKTEKYGAIFSAVIAKHCRNQSDDAAPPHPPHSPENKRRRLG
jgi:superfamily II DNA helicase RecQ